jgi:hypothetical protein
MRETPDIQLLISAVSVTSSVLKGHMIFQVFIGVFFWALLKDMFLYYNNLALILHLPIMNFIVPANLSFVFKILIPVVMFDIFEGYSEDIYSGMFEITS